MRKKLSEMTYLEKMDRMMKDASYEEAEEVGIEILARCMAFHVYALKEDEYVMNLFERIADRSDKWAHEGWHTIYLVLSAAFAKEKKRREEAEKG